MTNPEDCPLLRMTRYCRGLEGAERGALPLARAG